MLQGLGQGGVGVGLLSLGGHAHGYAEAKNNARDSGVNTGFQEEGPGDKAQGQQDYPGRPLVVVEQFFVFVGQPEI